MPKMKTRKAVAKRYTVTRTGKIRYKKPGLRHILTKKTRKRKRNLRAPGIIDESTAKVARQMLPYS